ncbi:hypothetical protein GOP47_0016598 [Adiantum capillus-veneris]|uniref:Uncharacterized protein n=1 Tax=Adiantum capillus-veneris TaxID=13818 RepID=A0A9D4UIV9_ADICA|nr:hypothetical protein GOP47_0016598 [Adiantum capillus-veneris]
MARAEKKMGDSSNCSLQLLEGVDIPAEIAVPSGHELKEAYYAEGLQHYVFNGSAWVVFNATATLYSVEGAAGNYTKVGGRRLVQAAQKKYRCAVGQHFFLGRPDPAGGQPSWETILPAYSLVTARSLQAVTVDPRSITWNLFQATSYSSSQDVLGAVTYLQRLASKGGLPPLASLGAQFGDIHVTPYSIIYAFYVEEKQ